MLKILVADDDPISRCYLSKTLENAGYVVFQSSDGERAYHALSDNPDIVLLVTDMMMPTLDGRGLIERSRADGLLKSCGVILLSAVVEPNEVKDLTAENIPFLAKPVGSDQLLAAVERLLA